MVEVRIDTDARGPMFDGRIFRVIEEYRDQANYRIATEAEDLVRDRLDQVLKNPTPYYETKIDVRRAGSGYQVWDQDIVYGPWLAGTGSRNYPATRFRGYDHWKLARDLTQRRARRIAQRLLRRFTRRM